MHPPEIQIQQDKYSWHLYGEFKVIAVLRPSEIYYRKFCLFCLLAVREQGMEKLLIQEKQ
jgi:hypothetical protein